jgi:purine-nucleoside phosphorylase
MCKREKIMNTPTPHIGAKKGQIASRMLLPGDPLRAEWIAEKFLTDVVRYSKVRNMLGFTGTFEGRRVSVQGGGMGMPSLSIYANELFDKYDVQEIIRVGSCGGLQADLKTRDIVIAQGSCSESSMNKRRFKGMDFAPIADWDLLYKAFEMAKKLAISVRVGNILSADWFYHDVDPEEWKLWAKYNVLAVEMETAELYTLAAKRKKKALTILTVSDSLVTHETLSSDEREKSFADMVRIALAI